MLENVICNYQKAVVSIITHSRKKYHALVMILIYVAIQYLCNSCKKCWIHPEYQKLHTQILWLEIRLIYTNQPTRSIYLPTYVFIHVSTYK
jgi:hypothetical protein